ncbi:MAG: glycosyltransferase family 1 protein [Elusimicrobiota bacterium]
MKIIIEVSPQIEGKRGIGNYIENLIKHLAKIDRENEYVILTWFFRDYSNKINLLSIPSAPNFSFKAIRFPDSILSKLEWSLNIPVVDFLIKDLKPDIYHSPGPRLPKLHSAKKIITVHDTIFEIYPQWCSTKYINANCKAIKTADKIIVDSENTKNDLIKFYNLPEDKITVIYLGVDAEIFHVVKNKETLGEIQRKYCLPDKFILSVGPFEPRRNTQGLLRAYKKAKEKLSEFKIILVGRKTLEISKEIANLGLTDDVIFTGHVEQSELVCLYNLASVFVHPSFYEGFGLQILEAMACGCPVITSNVSSLHEIAGSSAMIVDPGSIEKIAAAMVSAIHDKNMKAKLVQSGFEQISRFSWEKTAHKTLETYKMLLGNL